MHKEGLETILFFLNTLRYNFTCHQVSVSFMSGTPVVASIYNSDKFSNYQITSESNKEGFNGQTSIVIDVKKKNG